MMRIGIYGGSFNPPHNGHVGVALRAKRELALDKVLVVPAACSPFKVGKAHMDDDLRWRMVVAAFAGRDGFEPCDVDLRRGGVSYAIDTVRWVRERYPGAEVHFIIGEDSVAGLPRWKDWETLKELAIFNAYPRTPESSTEIRARLLRGDSVADLVPPAVAELLVSR